MQVFRFARCSLFVLLVTTTSCEWQEECIAGLSLGSSENSVRLEPTFEAEPGDYTIYLANPTLHVKHQGRIKSESGSLCDGLVVRARLTSVYGGEMEFVKSESGFRCPVEVNWDRYEVVCEIDSNSIALDSNDGAEIDVKLVVTTTDGVDEVEHHVNFVQRVP